MAKGVVKATVPIAIQPGTKLLHLIYEPDTDSFQLWLHHDNLMQHGTYLRLERGGGIERVTEHVDGSVSTFRVR